MRDIKKLLRKGVMEIDPYIPGKPIEEVQAELGISEIIKLASNENPLGPSPRALAAMEEEIKNVHLYPEGPCTLLREEMARRLGVGEDMITFSNGADNCILLAASAFLNEGDEALMADLTFSFYKIATQIVGGRPVYVGLKDHVHDLETMMKKIGPRTKLVFVCNPNNPTGSIVRKGELDDFVYNLPETAVLILDEAYCEFASDTDYSDALCYIHQGHNVISVRTFSKLYGLAGIRIGYALGPREFIDAMNRVREPFPVSRLAQVAALAALGDEEFREAVLRNNEKGKEYLYEAFEKMGMPYVATNTNFVFVDLKRDVKEIFQSLLRQGVIIRPGYVWDLPTCARVTIGTMEQNRKFISALEKLV
jgi:histidinol-phosphate aminotransferase